MNVRDIYPGVQTPECWCGECWVVFLTQTGQWLRHMILCPECGNKRCPKANYHGHECTGSNEPGQKGSAYE